MVYNLPFTDFTLKWLEVILAERFGHKWYFLRIEEGLRLQHADAEGAIIFDTIVQEFTTSFQSTMFIMERENEGWYSILGEPLPAPGVVELPQILLRSKGLLCSLRYPYYFMLARVEEINRLDLDSHKRFPATSSHAYKHGYRSSGGR